MNDNILMEVKKMYEKNPDLIVREISLPSSKTIYILFLESIASSTKINDFILKNITLINEREGKKKKLSDQLATPNLTKIYDKTKIDFYLANGFAIIIEESKIFAIETKAEIFRSINEPSSEKSLYGPKDSFNENIQINTGLIKRRIKSINLKTETMNIGRASKTTVNILFMDNIADIKLVNKMKKTLNEIDIDAILDSSNIADFIIGEKKTVLPTIASTERPDRVASSLLEGKIIILVDNSPHALILPTFFVDFINPYTDNYTKNNSINFVKFLRFFCFFMTIFIPGTFVAVIAYNPEIIPTSLLINFASQIQNVPFPVFIEAIIMIFVCEILRESDLRFPNNYGSAISIMGALVLGEAAVKAGIVSSIMIIVMAFTYISSLIFTELTMINAIRHFRWLFLIAGSFLGIYGIVLAFIYFIIHITNLDSIGYPYFYTLAPFDFTYFKKTLLKKPIRQDKKRAKILAKQNLTKQRSYPK